jgi:hypothetical protein
VRQTSHPTPYALPGCCRRSTAAPECANRHAVVTAGAAIPEEARQFGRALRRHSEKARDRTSQLSSMMFGQTFGKLPRLLREPPARVRANCYFRLCELCLCASVRTRNGTFNKCLRKPSGKVAQTFGLVSCKPSASCCANLRLRLRKREFASDLLKNISVRAPGAPKFIEYEHGT